MTMSKKNRDRRAAKDLRLTGNQLVEMEEAEAGMAVAFHRSRKARRAQARIDGYVWRAMTDEQRLLQ